MSTFASTLSSIARSKLQSTVGGGLKDNCSLHRWVLLKNSITRYQPPPSPAIIQPASSSADTQYLYKPVNQDEDVEEELDIDEEDAFVFPDPDAFLDNIPKASASEAQWLDTLLESLSDDDAGDYTNPEPPTPIDDEEDALYSPSLSPVSSSEDLVNNSSFYQSLPVAVPYPIPYPPLFHPPLISSEEFGYRLDRVEEVAGISDGLPYYDVDDLDDLSVPEAVEDVSDDESEILPSSLFTRSSASFSVDPASIPLPPDSRGGTPHVYDTDDPYMYNFELDPLPFAGRSHEYGPTVYQEC